MCPLSAFQIIKNEKLIQDAPVVVFDANLSLDCIATVLELCGKYDIPGMFLCIFYFYQLHNIPTVDFDALFYFPFTHPAHP